MASKQVIGEAHGKLILVGEHIVVYDKPAIAIPCPLKIKARIQEKPGEITIESTIFTGKLCDMPEKMAGLFECIHLSLELCNEKKKGIHIEINSKIPEGTGLGSSAAVATAIVRGIFQYYQTALSQEQLFSLVELAETYAHGRPSGIDMISVASEEPIFFQKSKGAITLTSPHAFSMVVADTGKLGVTKKAVTHVKALKIQRPMIIEGIIDEIEDIVMSAKEAILEGDAYLLGKLMLRNHKQLQKLEVSDSMLDHLVEVAVQYGAYGAKLTGGGMGGCMIAISKDIEAAKFLSKKLMSEGAKAAWYFSTNSNYVEGSLI